MPHKSLEQSSRIEETLDKYSDVFLNFVFRMGWMCLQAYAGFLAINQFRDNSQFQDKSIPQLILPTMITAFFIASVGKMFKEQESKLFASDKNPMSEIPNLVKSTQEMALITIKPITDFWQNKLYSETNHPYQSIQH